LIMTGRAALRRDAVSWLVIFTIMVLALHWTRDYSWGIDIEVAVIGASIGVSGAAATRRNRANKDK
jgi:hypothetical protein